MSIFQCFEPNLYCKSSSLAYHHTRIYIAPITIIIGHRCGHSLKRPGSVTARNMLSALAVSSRRRAGVRKGALPELDA